MALSRSARRAIARKRATEKLERFARRAIAERNAQVNAIVKRNLSGPRPERTAKGLTQDYSSFSSGSVSPQKHCEAKQRLTINGKTCNVAKVKDNVFRPTDKRNRPDYESWKVV